MRAPCRVVSPVRELRRVVSSAPDPCRRESPVRALRRVVSSAPAPRRGGKQALHARRREISRDEGWLDVGRAIVREGVRMRAARSRPRDVSRLMPREGLSEGVEGLRRERSNGGGGRWATRLDGAEREKGAFVSCDQVGARLSGSRSACNVKHGVSTVYGILEDANFAACEIGSCDGHEKVVDRSLLR